MTVHEAANKLLEYFASHDYFQLSKDFPKTVLISDTDADKAAVIVALEQLEKQQFVTKKEVNGEEYWILFKPLAFQMQDVPISLMTALQIANLLNNYTDKPEEKANPIRITEQDIINLTYLATKQA